MNYVCTYKMVRYKAVDARLSCRRSVDGTIRLSFIVNLKYKHKVAARLLNGNVFV